MSERLHGAVCSDCVEESLLGRLPLLKRTLEANYGPAVDQWLADGRFLHARWNAGLNLLVTRERLQDFVKDVIKEAVDKGELGLSLPGDDELWKPTAIEELLDAVYEQCREGIQELNKSLAEAISGAPTREAERELIEIVSGRRHVDSQEIRDEAISAVMITEGTPLPLPAKALIELRYRSDGGRASYIRVEEDEISSVWRDIEESLPEEIVKLICDDNSF